MSFKSEVLNILTTTPEDLPLLIQDTRNKQFLLRVLSSYMPYKVGVEIECNGSLSNIMKKYPDELTKELGCVQYHDDYAGGPKLGRAGYDAIGSEPRINKFCEHRICFNGWTQAIALKRLCLLLQEYCMLNPGGAIHMHINTPEINGMYDDYGKKAKARLLKRVINNSYLLQFDALKNREKYELRAEEEDKCYKINLRARGTVEFRLWNCSFNYQEIATNIVRTQQIMRRVRASCGWKVDLEEW